MLGYLGFTPAFAGVYIWVVGDGVRARARFSGLEEARLFTKGQGVIQAICARQWTRFLPLSVRVMCNGLSPVRLGLHSCLRPWPTRQTHREERSITLSLIIK